MSKRDRAIGSSEGSEVANSELQGRPRRRPLLHIVVAVMTALLLAVVFAPTIVSLTPLGPHLVASAAQGQIDGSLEVKSLSIGWLSPVTMRGLIIKDQQGEMIGSAESLLVGKSLLALISNSQDLGTITINKPQLLLVARPDGSNLEDLFAPLLNAPASDAATPSMAIEVHGGIVKLVDAATEESWDLPLDAHVESPRGAEQAWKLSLQAKLNNAGIVVDALHGVGDNATTHVALDADRFPLEPLQPLLARVLGPVRLSGGLTGKIEADQAAGGKRQSLVLNGVDAQQLTFASAAILGDDVLSLSQVTANGSAQLNEGVWQLRDLEIRSEVAALTGSGDVRVSDFAAGAVIPQTDCEIQGVVDLARLMQLLPHTLHAREGVQLTSGQATVSLTSEAAAGGRRFAATLATQDVQATSQGRPISLEEPVQFTAAVLQMPHGWQIEKLDAHSSFLNATATGTLEEGNVTLRGDLNKLAAELDQFVDLGELRLAGELAGSMQWQEEASGTLAAAGELNFRAFELAMPGVMPWREENLVVSLQGKGISTTEYTVANGGKVTVRSGEDSLDLVLQPGVQVGSNSVPIDARLTGELATWLPRLQGFLPLAGWQVAGPVNISAKGTASAARIDISDARFNIKQLRLQGNGLHIYEPEVAGTLQASYDVASGAASVPTALLQSASAAVQADQLLVQMGTESKISGDVAVHGDVGRMMAWFTDPRVPSTSQFTGETEAEATFTFVGGVTKANLKGRVTNLAYLTSTPQPVADVGRVSAREISTAAGWETAWSEPLITFGGDAAYDLAKDAISLDRMQAIAGTSAVVASGTVSQLASRCQLDLNGELRYDLATWTPKIRPLLGPTFDLKGTGSKPFELHGPLWGHGPDSEGALLPLALTGKAGVAWEGAEWMALKVGPAEVAAEMKDSTIFVQPTKIPLSQGTLQMSPALALKGQNWLITHEQARVIDHIVITPEMCDTWIKYVFPPLAGATEAQGKFSVDIENATLPVNQPTQLNTKGTFTVHNVSVGPGPLARSLIGVVQQVKDFGEGKTGLESLAGLAGSYLPGGTPTVPPATGKQWLELPEQAVPVEVAEGRVYHTGLTLKTKEFVLRSSGSVGIADQSLQLVCEVPLRNEWLKDPKFAGLKGQTLKIPVKGTITNPKPDVAAAFSGLVGLGIAGIPGALGGQLQSGSTAVQGEIGKAQDKVQGEIGKAQDKVQTELDKAKKKAEDKLRQFFNPK